MKENELYGVSMAMPPGQLKEETVLMRRNVCYATTQDVHTTDNVNYIDYVPENIYTDVV